MRIIPAIDIKNGKVVRLFKGRFDKVTEYGSDPVDMARRWRDEGATDLHIVDLDGAESGGRVNEGVIKQIVKGLGIPVQVGGGIRSHEVIDDYLHAGVARVVLGTKVVQAPSFLGEVLAVWKDRVAVSLDCSNGYVAQRGWVELSTVKGVDLARDLVAMGLKYIIYTDIARDGTLVGPDIEGLKEMLDVGDVRVIASGGVKDIGDIRALASLGQGSLYGVIVGKAIYEGTLDLKDAAAAC